MAHRGIVVLATIAFSYHLKGVFYLPAFMLALVASGRGCDKYRLRAGAMAVLLLLAFFGYRYWSGRFDCPNDAMVADKLGHENVLAMLKGDGWGAVLAAVPIMIGNMSPSDYLHNILPAHSYMSSWLPPAPDSVAVLKLWRAITLFAWYVAAQIAAVLIFLSGRDRWPRRWPLVAAFVLAGLATAWAALQNNKNAYEATVYLPVLLLALAFLWAAPRRYRSWLAAPVLLIASLSALSQVLLIGSYAAPLWATVRGGGYVAGQPYSLSPFAYPRARILAAGAKCGIIQRPGLKRVLIDDLTYFAYAQSAIPVHRLGMLSDWNGSAGDPMVWMRRHGSPGAVLACAYMPPNMRARAIASGEICCVSTR
ncbi:hypothetical protein [Sphingomonas endolithica]|uniref:hypothetical protein n=1 Tax=Sphingomonas endolithica TaxID=2972485 RepID=UPI0021AE5394|nr:hypothetical protein [Sphingomonas sp. ZFBP2030]